MSNFYYSSRRGAVAAILAGACGLLLLGCTPADRIAARIVDGQLTFVACDSPVAQRLSVLVVDPGPDDPNPPLFWQADGDGTLWNDEPIVYGTAPAEFENAVAPISLPTDESRILIFLDELNDHGEVVRRVGGNFVASALNNTSWLQTGGLHTSQPCN